MNESKPFWLEEPWSILFDLAKMKKIDPWTINLEQIVEGFLEKLKSWGMINFTVPGIALLSSAILFKLKVDSLFRPLEVRREDGKERKPGKPRLEEFTLALPLRFQYASLDVELLFKLLVEVLEEASKPSPRKNIEEFTGVEFDFSFEESFEAQMEAWIEDLRVKLERLLASGLDYLSFSTLVEGMDLLGKVRTFIALLFLASQGVVELIQEDRESDILIAKPGGVEVGVEA